MNLNWQVCTIEQAETLKGLGIINPSDMLVWFRNDTNTGQNTRLCIKRINEEVWVCDGLPEEGSKTNSSFEAFTLSEIAVMLGYSFVSSNVKEAAERLIEELKNGCVLAKDANARLKEMQNS